MSARPFRHLCPEADMRDAMPEDEFWEHVLLAGHPEMSPDDEDLDPPATGLVDEPCGVCGELNACMWDAEGRPLIHATDRRQD
jgi:hypothetical protein